MNMLFVILIISNIQIDCDSDDCGQRYIDGSSANSLSVDCAGSGCAGSQIVCPVGVDSNCTIDCTVGSCNFAVIENADGGDMNSFVLHCQSCIYLSLSLDPDTISTVDILCESTTSVCLLPVF